MEFQIAEKDFQAQVITVARCYGWLVYHTYDSRRCQQGFPDLVLVRSGRCIFAELKSEKGRFTRDQILWLSVLATVPDLEVYKWRPSDWNDIQRILQR